MSLYTVRSNITPKWVPALKGEKPKRGPCPKWVKKSFAFVTKTDVLLCTLMVASMLLVDIWRLKVENTKNINKLQEQKHDLQVSLDKMTSYVKGMPCQKNGWKFQESCFYFGVEGEVEGHAWMTPEAAKQYCQSNFPSSLVHSNNLVKLSDWTQEKNNFLMNVFQKHYKRHLKGLQAQAFFRFHLYNDDLVGQEDRYRYIRLYCLSDRCHEPREMKWELGRTNAQLRLWFICEQTVRA